MARRKLIVANWKMHMTVGQSSLLVHRLSKTIKAHRNVEIVLTPSLLALQPISQEVDRRKFRLAAPNAYFVDEGAFTGEVSFTMLQDLVHYALIGHSERRIHFNEDLKTVQSKVTAAVRNDIAPILCVGESKVERLAGHTRHVLHDQVTTALHNLTADEVAEVVIAYEPVWAISTFGGELPKPDEVGKQIAYIRQQVADLYGDAVAHHMRVLYGGSVDENSAVAYLSVDGCDGFIVGGASLNYRKFSAIVAKTYDLIHSK